ncbi:MAG: DUF1501 domain-containing protein [Pirellula sp.]
MEPLTGFPPAGIPSAECESYRRFSRRRFLSQSSSAASGLLGAGMLTYVAERLAAASDSNPTKGQNAKSLIVLWLQGGPSQLETFDPHSGSIIGGDTKAIATSVKGLQLSDTLPKTAELMHHATLIRSMVSREGDHERATYNMKTGWRPDPTLIHPSIGAVVCHQSQNNIEIPRHVSILSEQWPARGGYMGNEFDAFQTGDPKNPLPNLRNYSDPQVFANRVSDLQDIAEKEFRRGRIRDLDRSKTLHESSTKRATTMMASEQIKAFDVLQETSSIVSSFGDTPFGRGCLAAVRLIENGVRCVEVELSGWDSHVDNHGIQSARCKVLDSALHGLFVQLNERGLLDSTIVMCSGEFGRTPSINVAGGRDHWPTGYSTLLAGGPFRRGHVHGETTNEKIQRGTEPLTGVKDPMAIEDLHTTILHSLGINFSHELQTPIGRPLVLSQGKIIASLLS